MILTIADKSKLVTIALFGGHVCADELPASFFLDGRIHSLVANGFVSDCKVSNHDEPFRVTEYVLTEKGWKEALNFVDPRQISGLYTYLSRIKMQLGK